MKSYKREYSNEKPKVALYTCNFGNYRNELSLYYNTLFDKFDKNIDYFLYTDKIFTNDEIKNLQNWNICNINTLESDEIMDSFRKTSKYVKFILPEELKDYDIIIWVDNKKTSEIHRLTYQYIIDLFENNSECDIFNLKHPERSTVQEELLITLKYNLENSESGKNLLIFFDNYVSKFDLPDTCVIIRKNNWLINETFKFCFEVIKECKVKRDQNIYNFCLDQKNVTPILLDYFTFLPIKKIK